MNIDNKFLLVCLQLIIVLLVSMIVEGMPNVSSRIDSSSNPIQRLPQERANRNERAYRLFNQCAFKEVLVQDKVSATANESDDKGDLVLETMMKGGEVRIRIRGLTSEKYLCYNRRGKLVAKPKRRARGAKCEFVEQPSGQYWSFMSALNNRWVIGFDPKGRGLLGSDHVASNYKEDCFRFAKIVRVADQLLPRRLIQNTFNVEEHNRKIGQPHPHLRPDFFSSRPASPSHQMRHHKNLKHPHHTTRARPIKKSQRNRKSSTSSSLPKTPRNDKSR